MTSWRRVVLIAALGVLTWRVVYPVQLSAKSYRPDREKWAFIWDEGVSSRDVNWGAMGMQGLGLLAVACFLWAIPVADAASKTNVKPEA